VLLLLTAKRSPRTALPEAYSLVAVWQRQGMEGVSDESVSALIITYLSHAAHYYTKRMRSEFFDLPFLAAELGSSDPLLVQSCAADLVRQYSAARPGSSSAPPDAFGTHEAEIRLLAQAGAAPPTSTLQRHLQRYACMPIDLKLCETHLQLAEWYAVFHCRAKANNGCLCSTAQGSTGQADSGRCHGLDQLPPRSATQPSTGCAQQRSTPPGEVTPHPHGTQPDLMCTSGDW
jgi:hypothetical protein